MLRGHQYPQDTAMEMRALMEESLEVLRHYRHDLMNQVQLIQAYAQLKKFDRLQAPIETLVQEAHRHSEWSSFPSSMMSYVVLTRGILYPMMNLHVSYEHVEASSPDAEMEASRVLGALLDRLGAETKRLLEPLPLDVWIASYGQGYEIGWFLRDVDAGALPDIDWEAWTNGLSAKGLTMTLERVEEGLEHVIRITL